MRQLFFFFCILLPFLTTAQKKNNLTNRVRDITIVQDATYWIDTTSKVDIEGLLKMSHDFSHRQDIKRDRFNHWVRFRIKNSGEKNLGVYIRVDYSRFENLQAYVVNNKGQIFTYPKTGWGTPIVLRPFPHYKHIFPLEMKPKEELTMYFSANSVYHHHSFPISISNYKETINSVNVTTLSDGVVGIVLLLSFLISIAFYISSGFKEPLNLWYASYSLNAFAFFFLRNTIQYFNSEQLNPYLNHLVTVPTVLLTLSYILSGLYFTSTVRINENLLRFSKMVLYALSFVNIAIYLSPISNNIELAFYTRLALFLYGAFILFYRVITGIVKKDRYALLFAFMAIPVVIGSSILIFVSDVSTENSGFDSALMFKIIITIETTLMLIGVVYKNNRIKKDLQLQIISQQKHFLEKQIEAEDNERQRIAQDLHDDLGNILVALQGQLHVNNPDMVKVNNTLLQASGSLRNIAHNLMPAAFENSTLSEIIAESVRKLNVNEATQWAFVKAGTEYSLPLNKALMIYRIASELLTNTQKHAKAKNVIIQLIYQQHDLILIIEDDGVGFDPETKRKNAGIGLKSLQSRVDYLGGLLTIDTGIHGTTIIAEIPRPK